MSIQCIFASMSLLQAQSNSGCIDALVIVYRQISSESDPTPDQNRQSSTNAYAGPYWDKARYRNKIRQDSKLWLFQTPPRTIGNVLILSQIHLLFFHA